MKILVRATNWIGDAVMSLPALRALREARPDAHIAILARPWVADVYARERFCDQLLPYSAPKGWQDLPARLRIGRELRSHNFDVAILLPNSFDSAFTPWLAGIPERIGYARDWRALMLTRPIERPKAGEIPRHERYYYLELLLRAGIIDRVPDSPEIRLDGAAEAAQEGLSKFASLNLGDTVIGVSPGAAYGTAKRWLPERFAESALLLAEKLDGSVALFGSKDEHALCEEIGSRIAAGGTRVHNFAGQTSLGQYISLAAACRAYLTNDSGAMHIASALGVPTVAVFGATDHVGTGPTGANAAIVREQVECSPCLKRECPIDHRCMTRVSAARVAETALTLLK
ncbi:MAG: lipopolysaccharide heptosyltransferase II [Bryobacteraceae bacterium]